MHRKRAATSIDEDKLAWKALGNCSQLRKSKVAKHEVNITSHGRLNKE